VHAYDAFNATHLPLAAYAESAAPYRLGMADLNASSHHNPSSRGFAGLTDEAATCFYAPTTGGPGLRRVAPRGPRCT